MTTKAQRARDLYSQGVTIVAISNRLDMEPTNVRKAVKRRSPAEEGHRRERMTIHNEVQPFKARPTPQGYCMAWVVENGRAHRCGALCKGQLCDDHAHTTLPIAAPLGRRDYA